MISEPSSTTIGTEWSEWGHIVLTINPFTDGARIGPLHASEYAVDPVGVETNTPSPLTVAV